jgi:hypothetical protein
MVETLISNMEVLNSYESTLLERRSINNLNKRFTLIC